MPTQVEFISEPRPQAVHSAAETARTAILALREANPLTMNLDMVRSVFARFASNHGLSCSIDPVGTAENPKRGPTENLWWVFLIDGNRAHYTVARILETQITDKDRPKLCPSCGKPVGEKDKAIHAHNVVADSTWDKALNSSLANTLDKWFPKADAQLMRRVKGNMNSYIKTTKPSTMGAATQGDRRTCRGCEQLQGSLSLVQRHDAVAEVTGTKSAKLKPNIVGVEFGGHELQPSMVSREFLVEATRQRIEDVVRGVANELYSDNYWVTKEGKRAPREGFEFIKELTGNTKQYFAFLDEIRQTAFQMATGEPLFSHEKTGLQRQAFLE